MLTRIPTIHFRVLILVRDPLLFNGQRWFLSRNPATSPSESGRPFGSRVVFVMEPGDTADFDMYDSSFNMWFPKGCWRCDLLAICKERMKISRLLDAAKSIFYLFLTNFTFLVLCKDIRIWNRQFGYQKRIKIAEFWYHHKALIYT